MSRHRVVMIVDIDEEELIEHVTSSKAEKPPYTTLVSEWDASDYFLAYDEGLLDAQEAVLVSVEEVKDEEGENG